MKRYIAALICIVGLAGCAAQPTQYMKAQGSHDYGYRESQLTTNRYRVSFSGNPATSQDRVKDFALKRAAELTMLNGHKWFRVMTQDTEHETHSTPSTTTTMSTPPEVRRDCGLFGCTTTVAPGYTGMSVTTSHQSNRYSSSIDIVMGDGKPSDPAAVYNAEELLAFLDKKY